MSRNKHSNDWKRELEEEERLTPEEKRLAACDQRELEAMNADLRECLEESRKEEEEEKRKFDKKFDEEMEIEAEFDIRVVEHNDRDDCDYCDDEFEGPFSSSYGPYGDP